MFNDYIPYTLSVLATITRYQVGTVEKALKVFQGLGLIEELDSGVIYMLDIQNYIGKSSTEADRQRAYQMKIANEKKMELSDCKKSTPDIELEKEREN